MARRYWLFKTEPEAFSWQDLLDEPEQTTLWDGVRNYQARNLLRDEMKRGDGVLFYHSRCNPPAIVGVAEVVRAGYPDPTQFDPKSRYFDAKAKPEAPRWYVVDVRAKRPLRREISLGELKEAPGLGAMAVTQRGARLSVQPVTAAEWKIVLGLEKRPRG